MKRVKCYGRMKTACIDERLLKVFNNDDDDVSLWNLSFTEKSNAALPKPNCYEKERKNTTISSSPPLFARLSSSLNSENDENLPPKAKAKPKKVKNKVKRNAPRKKFQKPNKKRVSIKEVTEKDGVPDFSVIEEYSLFVEKNSFSKKRENFHPYSTRSKHVCLAATKEMPSAHLSCASSNEIMPHDALSELHALERSDLEVDCDSNTCEVQYSPNKKSEKTSVSRDDDDSSDRPLDLHSVNIRRPFKNMNHKYNLNKDLLWEEVLGSPQKISEKLPVKNSLGFENVPSGEKFQDLPLGNIEIPDTNFVEVDSSKEHENSRSGKLAENHQSDQTSLSESCSEIQPVGIITYNHSNSPNEVSCHIFEAVDSDPPEKALNSKSEKTGQGPLFPEVQNSLPFNPVAPCRNIKGFIWNSTPVVKERKLKPTYPSPNVSSIMQPNFLCGSKSSIDSCVKKFKFVTSTPSVPTNKQPKERLPLCNISCISQSENKANSCMGKSAAFSQSLLCYRNVSNFNKSRSLTVAYDVSKILNQLNHCETGTHQMQFASDSNKSRTCLERVASRKSATPSDFHQSLSIAEKLLELCGQESVAPITSVYDWSLIKIKKIGEGTYGEVFMLSQKKPSVIKIIPISQDTTTTWLNLESVYSEVKVSYCLSALRKNKHNKTSNFSKVNRVHFVKGCYPDKLIAAWDTFSMNKSTYNLRPDCFNHDQLYVILDLEYGGKDMTCFEMKNAIEAESILKQITISLAIAEETHLFEHRDLHLGNILVQKVKKKTISYVLGGKPLSIPSQGVMVTIIDFTLSRVFDAGCVYFHNLADDESLFNQSGDLQFEIYRATRKHLQNQWHDCALYSNVLWLTFLCAKMKEYKYRNPTSKTHLKMLHDIAEFQKGLKFCQSALDSLKLCKLPTSVPTNSSVESLQMLKTKFVDRKSLQKSKTNFRN